MTSASEGSLRLLLGTICVLLVAWGTARPAGAEPDPCACYECKCVEPAMAKCPTKYENLRFEEDWAACLCTPLCDRPDGSDRMKARRIGPGSYVRVDVGGQIRFRYEAWWKQGFGAPIDSDDAWGLVRVRAHADVHVGDWGRLFVEGIYADIHERELGPRPIDRNRGDLLNAFVEVGAKAGGWNLLGRLGRQELQEGKQRLVSPLDWANTRRTFDAVFGRVARGPHRLDLWVSQPVLVAAEEFDESDDDILFWGAYYTLRQWTCLAWEAYAFGLHRDTATYLGVTADEDRYTVGGRVEAKIPRTRFDVDTELAAQFGTFGDEDVFAAMLSIEAGWKPCLRCWDPRLALGFDYASGDEAGGELNTFNQLYPLGHAYLGYADLIGRQNLVAGRFTATAKPADDLTLRVDYHGFWRASEDDAVYNAAGGVLRAAGGADDLFVGTELDVSLLWQIDRHWRAAGGWAHFFAGDFLEATGSSDDVDFVWVEAQFTF